MQQLDGKPAARSIGSHRARGGLGVAKGTSKGARRASQGIGWDLQDIIEPPKNPRSAATALSGINDNLTKHTVPQFNTNYSMKSQRVFGTL